MPKRIPDIERREPTPAEKAKITITKQWLEERCFLDHRTGCLVWKGFITKSGQPQCRITVAPKLSATMLVRRLVAKMRLMRQYKNRMTNDKANEYMRDKQVNSKAQECVRGCCNPMHMVIRTKIEAMARYKGTPMSLAHKLKISAAKRKVSKVSDEVIKRVIADPRPAKHVSVEIGMSDCYVAHVREGKLRSYSVLGDGMFSGLLAPANGAFYDEKETA